MSLGRRRGNLNSSVFRSPTGHQRAATCPSLFSTAGILFLDPILNNPTTAMNFDDAQSFVSRLAKIWLGWRAR
jgi:hypothetical protein